MADWTNIVDSQLEPDAPLTSDLAFAWRDNLLAAMQGAAGAERLRIGALERLVAGDQIRSRRDGEVSASVPTTITSLTFAFLQAGSVRCRWEHRCSGNPANGTTSLLRVRNGSTTTIASFSNGTSYVGRTADADVLPGDEIRFTNNTPVGSGVGPYLRNCRLSTAGGNLWPAGAYPVEGNTYNA